MSNKDPDFAYNPLAIIVSSLPTNNLKTSRGRREKHEIKFVVKNCKARKVAGKISFRINKPYGTNFLHHPTQIDFKFIQNTIHINVILVYVLLLSLAGGEQLVINLNEFIGKCSRGGESY